MTNTPIQIAERAPKPHAQNELSREANLSPKIEAPGARQGRRYGAEMRSGLFVLKKLEFLRANEGHRSAGEAA